MEYWSEIELDYFSVSVIYVVLLVEMLVKSGIFLAELLVGIEVELIILKLFDGCLFVVQYKVLIENV